MADLARRVLILDGDGFCGWPTALRLSATGYDVTIVDNLSRRKIGVELECESLTPIAPPKRRLKTRQRLTGKKIAPSSVGTSAQHIDRKGSPQPSGSKPGNVVSLPLAKLR